VVPVIRKVVVPVACLMSLAACGGSSEPKATSPTKTQTVSPTPAASKAPSKATLKPALLTVSDFPTGWTTKPVDDSEGDLSGDCADKLKAFDKKYPDATDKVEADFEEDSAELDETIQGYASAAELAAEFAEYSTVVRECESLTTKIEGHKIVLTVGEIPRHWLPNQPGECAAWRAAGLLHTV
jgi:hypothetical protein